MNLERLVEEYKNGIEKSFDKLYEATLPIVRAAIINYVTERETVLDLIQDTYLVFVESKDKYVAKSFSNYIYTIAKNKAIDYVKRKKEILTDDVDYIPDYKLSPCLNYMINKLEEPLREVFILKVLVGYSSKKVSQSLNIDVNKVNKLYYEAKEILRKGLDLNEI
ncbi:MAG: sigma-70 family RNA polymerase sigma factor [Acholeplasmatales bacterium]|nr:sigma-70 family RNA polymerase sigma factor [Acholeplasmatales bacterium]